MDKNAFQEGNPVRWKLQHKGGRLSLEKDFSKQPPHKHRKKNTEEVNGKDDISRLCTKACSCHQDIDRQPGAAAYERIYQHGDHPVAPALQHPGSHNCRCVAAESHDERNEGLTVEPHDMHETVGREGCPGHVPAVFEERNKEKEYHDGRHIHNNTPDARDHAIYHQIPGEPFGEQKSEGAGESLYEPGKPCNRVISQGESRVKHEPEQKNKYGVPQHPVRHHPVNLVGNTDTVGFAHLVDFMENTPGKAIPAVGNEGFRLVCTYFFYMPVAFFYLQLDLISHGRLLPELIPGVAVML